MLHVVNKTSKEIGEQRAYFLAKDKDGGDHILNADSGSPTTFINKETLEKEFPDAPLINIKPKVNYAGVGSAALAVWGMATLELTIQGHPVTLTAIVIPQKLSNIILGVHDCVVNNINFTTGSLQPHLRLPNNTWATSVANGSRITNNPFLNNLKHMLEQPATSSTDMWTRSMPNVEGHPSPLVNNTLLEEIRQPSLPSPLTVGQLITYKNGHTIYKIEKIHSSEGSAEIQKCQPDGTLAGTLQIKNVDLCNCQVWAHASPVEPIIPTLTVDHDCDLTRAGTYKINAVAANPKLWRDSGGVVETTDIFLPPGTCHLGPNIFWRPSYNSVYIVIEKSNNLPATLKSGTVVGTILPLLPEEQVLNVEIEAHNSNTAPKTKTHKFNNKDHDEDDVKTLVKQVIAVLVKCDKEANVDNTREPPSKRQMRRIHKQFASNSLTTALTLNEIGSQLPHARRGRMSPFRLSHVLKDREEFTFGTRKVGNKKNQAVMTISLSPKFLDERDPYDPKNILHEVNLLLEEEVTTPSPAEEILNDPKYINNSKLDAQGALKIITKWTKEERIQQAAATSKMFKDATLEMSQKLDKTTYNNIGKENGNGSSIKFPIANNDDEDGIELNEARHRLDFSNIIRDNKINLNSVQFLLLSGVHTWLDGVGKPLIDAEPTHAQQFASNLCLYRAAGIFREYNGTPLPMLRGFKIELEIDESKKGSYRASGLRKHSEEETRSIYQQAKRLVASGACQDSNSPYSSGLVCVQKPHGGGKNNRY